MQKVSFTFILGHTEPSATFKTGTLFLEKYISIDFKFNTKQLWHDNIMSYFNKSI